MTGVDKLGAGRGVIAVTGATGFIGSHVVRVLLEKGYKVHTFGRKPVAGTVFHEWDATKPCPDYGIRFQSIVHCAASARDWGLDEDIAPANMQGTRSALAIDKKSQFIHISTASIYASKGDSHNIKEVESEGLRGTFLNVYCESKFIAENIVRWDRRPAGSFILRPHAVYGPGDTTLLPRVEKALRGKILPLPNGGKSLISLTRVETLVDVIVDLIEYKGLNGHGIFNVADREPVVLRDALKEILSQRGKKVKVLGIPAEFSWQLGTLMQYVAKAYNLGRPPLTPYIVSQLGYAETLDVSGIEEFLGRKMPASDFSDAGSW
jgi:nucleoside-diphosphate-sugar epimerase